MAQERLYRRPADFRVRYSFRWAEQGGRSSGPPRQGYRCDFLYEDQAPERDPVYYIWPSESAPGARGYLLEGNRIVADVEVLDVLAASSGA